MSLAALDSDTAPRGIAVGLVDQVRRAALPLATSPGTRDEVTAECARARVVLLGAALEGSETLVRLRADLTRRLVVAGAFGAVAIDADWPDALRLHRFVSGETAELPPPARAGDGMAGWRWMNHETVRFVRWLRAFNAALPAAAPKVGLCSLDLFSRDDAIASIIAELELTDAFMAARARAFFARSDGVPVGDEGGSLAFAASLLLEDAVRDRVVGVLVERTRRVFADLGAEVPRPPSDPIHDPADARRALVKAGEHHRALLSARSVFWNLRARHMAETLDRLLARLGDRGVIAWQPSLQVADARATELRDAGHLTLGQLARERHGGDVRLVDLTAYEGQVLAAPAWGAPAVARALPLACPDGHEALFHQAVLPGLFLRCAANLPGLRAPRYHRALGVVIPSAMDATHQQLQVRLLDAFDFVGHLEETVPLEVARPPLERPGEASLGRGAGVSRGPGSPSEPPCRP